jgi:FkbM family methyltransferase
MLSDRVLSDLTRLATKYGILYTVVDDLITRQLVDFGAHTRNELAMLLKHVDTDDVFVDIGAHVGTFTIPVAKKLGTRGKVLAIEGRDETFSILAKNVGANGLAHKVQPLCAIVGQGPKQKLRRVDVDGNTGASFYAPDETSAQEAVDAKSLISAYGFARPDFVKIDIEGMELSVLRSIAPIIATHRPKLYVEVVADQLARFGASIFDLDAFLRSFDYRFYRNIGERNSPNDHYLRTELLSLEDGGRFFDLLALPDWLAQRCGGTAVLSDIESEIRPAAYCDPNFVKSLKTHNTSG